MGQHFCTGYKRYFSYSIHCGYLSQAIKREQCCCPSVEVSMEAWFWSSSCIKKQKKTKPLHLNQILEFRVTTIIICTKTITILNDNSQNFDLVYIKCFIKCANGNNYLHIKGQNQRGFQRTLNRSWLLKEEWAWAADVWMEGGPQGWNTYGKNSARPRCSARVC